ncbi:hypothetical protein KCP76_23825 [Salmonella enterica subsp. enterica serovar Weltevreden]|nr:hypothetical protein KCP76_23825 [Salmonella enterica subsp. enterica serovar Weltevreden]
MTRTSGRHCSPFAREAAAKRTGRSNRCSCAKWGLPAILWQAHIGISQARIPLLCQQPKRPKCGDGLHLVTAASAFAAPPGPTHLPKDAVARYADVQAMVPRVSPHHGSSRPKVGKIH